MYCGCDQMSGVEASLGSVDLCWTLSCGSLITDPTSILPLDGLVREPRELALRTGKKGLVSEVMMMLGIWPIIPLVTMASDESPACRSQTKGEMRNNEHKMPNDRFLHPIIYATWQFGFLV